MADAIVRLKVESQEYDQKLQRATQQLQHMEKEVRRTGATFAYADKEELAFVKSLGTMETKATSAQGKIAEMTKTFTELSLQYKRMTDEEKASPFGKALAGSLDQLKARIKDSKSDLADVQGQLTSFGDVAQQLGSKLGLPIDQLTKFGPYGAAAAAAIKIATDAFKQNEELLDDWNATVESASSVYDGFLNALNTGDFSSFFQNIRNIVQAARDAYDALDQLGTFNAFNQINVEKARTGFTESMTNFREGTGSKADVQAAAKRLQDELATRMKYEQNAYLKRISRLAETKGVDADLLTKALSGSYGDYEALKATKIPTKSVWNSSTRAFEERIDNESATIEQKLGQALRQLNDTELNNLQALGAQAQRTATEIEQINRQVIRVTGAKGASAGVSGASAVTPTAATDATTLTYADDSIKAQEAKVAELTKLWKEASTELRDGYYAQLQKAKAELEEMTKGPLTELKGQMGFDVEPVKIKIDSSNLKLAKNDAKGMADAFSIAASAVSTVGSALQQIEDPAAKVAGIVAQAIAQIALTFAMSLKGTVTPWDWIAAAAAGTATMISTITAIKAVTSAKGYAEGGMVGGSSYSGDNIVARLNSGEGVLTAQGVQNAANMANVLGNGGGGGSSQPYLTGDVIILGVNNYLGRSGQGEIVTTSMLRRAGIRL